MSVRINWSDLKPNVRKEMEEYFEQTANALEGFAKEVRSSRDVINRLFLQLEVSREEAKKYKKQIFDVKAKFAAAKRSLSQETKKEALLAIDQAKKAEEQANTKILEMERRLQQLEERAVDAEKHLGESKNFSSREDVETMQYQLSSLREERKTAQERIKDLERKFNNASSDLDDAEEALEEAKKEVIVYKRKAERLEEKVESDAVKRLRRMQTEQKHLEWEVSDGKSPASGLRGKRRVVHLSGFTPNGVIFPKYYF